MRSDNKALSVVQDALGLGASKVDTAYTVMNKVMERVDEIKVKLVAAVGSSADNRARRRPARRCRHEQGIDPAPGAAGTAAAWHPVAADRQQQRPARALAVPELSLRTFVTPVSLRRARSASRKGSGSGSSLLFGLDFSRALCAYFFVGKAADFILAQASDHTLDWSKHRIPEAREQFRTV